MRPIILSLAFLCCAISGHAQEERSSVKLDGCYQVISLSWSPHQNNPATVQIDDGWPHSPCPSPIQERRFSIGCLDRESKEIEVVVRIAGRIQRQSKGFRHGGIHWQVERM